MNNVFKKTAMALAIAGTTTLVSVAHADPLFAPLVVNDAAAGIETFFSMRAGAIGSKGTNPGNMHYYWFKKGESVNDLYNLTKGCEVENTWGTATQNDMVYQSARAYKLTTFARKRLPRADFGSAGVADGSSPSGYPGNFAGMTVVDFAGDTDSTGMGYVVDKGNGFMVSYGLLNAKQVADSVEDQGLVHHTWYPVGKVTTKWLGVAVPDFGSLSTIENSTGYTDSLSLRTDGSVAYNKDESPVSGTVNRTVTCMGIYDRTHILKSAQESSTRTGGFVTMTNTAGGLWNQGSLVYKMEVFKKNADFLSTAPAAGAPSSFLLEQGSVLSQAE